MNKTDLKSQMQELQLFPVSDWANLNLNPWFRDILLGMFLKIRTTSSALTHHSELIF